MAGGAETRHIAAPPAIARQHRACGTTESIDCHIKAEPIEQIRNERGCDGRAVAHLRLTIATVGAAGASFQGSALLWCGIQVRNEWQTCGNQFARFVPICPFGRFCQKTFQETVQDCRFQAVGVTLSKKRLLSFALNFLVHKLLTLLHSNIISLRKSSMKNS